MTYQDQLERLLDCMCAALAAVGWEGECCLTPGQPAFDACCAQDGGSPLAWARLVRVFPARAEGEGRPVGLPEVSWRLEVELGATTCICDDQCDCEARGENAARVLAMAEAGLAGVVCCGSDDPCEPPEVVEMGPIGPEGGCGGFAMTVTVGHTSCCPAPAAEPGP